jgi:anti-sigma regulatory factor (Ser/Thr protein kinase)
VAIREPGMLGEIVLPAGAAAPGAARLVIAHCLTGLVARSVVDDARLLGSELVYNSVQHGGLRGGEPLLVRLYLGADAVRIEVENPGTFGAVTTRPPDGRSAGGFGLQLVELLAARWGVRRGRETTVWFEMARS